MRCLFLVALFSLILAGCSSSADKKSQALAADSVSTPAENPATEPGLPGDYTFATTSLLTDSDIEKYRIYELIWIRNEIFARHGYIFKNEDLRMHFSNMKWYKPVSADVTKELTEIEKKNIALLLSRETGLYVSRPIAKLIKTLPLLSLPANLESDPAAGVTFPDDIENPSGNILTESPYYKDQDYGQKLYGLVPDTSRFYGVVWYGPGAMNLGGGLTPCVYITTFDKKLRPIGTSPLWVSHDNGMGAGDCNATDENYESVLKEDLTFSSTYTAQVSCAGDDGPSPRESSISGRINRDGSIVSAPVTKAP